MIKSKLNENMMNAAESRFPMFLASTGLVCRCFLRMDFAERVGISRVMKFVTKQEGFFFKVSKLPDTIT